MRYNPATPTPSAETLLMNQERRQADGGASESFQGVDAASQSDPFCSNAVAGRQSGTHRRAWEGSQIRVQLADFLPVILQAAVDRSRWLEDFANEPILISRDFHEVLSNYIALRDERRRAG